MRQLDHVAQKVLYDIRNKVAPSGYSEAMLAWRAYNEEDSPAVSGTADIVFSIHESPRQSEILEALLLSGCPPEIIQEALSVPVAVTEWYAELFFDIAVFRTDLDRLEYLEDYADPWGRDLKLKAVNLGYEFVLFNFANLVPKTASQKKLVERMFMATAYKAMAMNYNGIKSEVNRQAVKHAELMIKAFDLLAKTNADDTNGSYDLVSLLAADDAGQGGSVVKPKAEDII
jgi:hypothetical protein